MVLVVALRSLMRGPPGVVPAEHWLHQLKLARLLAIQLEVLLKGKAVKLRRVQRLTVPDAQGEEGHRPMLVPQALVVTVVSMVLPAVVEGRLALVSARPAKEETARPESSSSRTS